MRQLCLVFPHGTPPEIDLVRVVYQPVEDGIGQRWIADEVMPFVDR